jgi:hypothetical protein
MALSSYQPFDPARDIQSLRGDFFSTSPLSRLDRAAMTDAQADFLTNRFVSQILPLQKELAAFDERRTQRAYNDLRLQEAAFSFDQAKEETKLNREILTRIPSLLQDLGDIEELADENPEEASKLMLGLQRDNYDVYGKNPAFQTVFNGSMSRVAAREDKRKAEENFERDRAAKFLATEDPELIEYGKSLAAVGGLTDQETRLIADAEVLRKAGLKRTERETEKAAASSWRDDEISKLNKASEWLMQMKVAELPEGYIPGVSKETPPLLTRDDEELLNYYAANAKVPNPDPDPFRLRNQILAALDQQKQQLRGGVGSSSIPTTMRNATAER